MQSVRPIPVAAGNFADRHGCGRHGQAQDRSGSVKLTGLCNPLEKFEESWQLLEMPRDNPFVKRLPDKVSGKKSVFLRSLIWLVI